MVRDESESEALTVPEPVAASRVDIDNAPSSWDADAERYEPLGPLGRGGMGEIALVKDTRIARDVAMKLLRKEYREDREFRERFLFEARLQGQLEHPSIVPVHDLGVTRDGELYFTMKRIRGTTLANAMKDVLAGEGPYSRRRLLTAFSSVCLAVDFAHTRGVVHRDLKPHNIMLGDFGEVYILDWGIAKLLDRADTPLGQVVEVPGADSSRTRAGTTLGTPPYIAPEREAGAAADPRSDVYSLGVILGQIVETDDDITPELASIANRACARDRGKRFATARELHDALERYLDGDRDLEARRKAAADHVERAERALATARTDPDARATIVRDVGRALGLDPSNAAALRILMRLLSEPVDVLPQAAQDEIDRRWLLRRTRTMRIGAVSTALLVLLVPFWMWMGVRSWAQVSIFVALVAAGAACQLVAAHRPHRFWFAAAFAVQMLASVAATLSVGLAGITPAAFTIATVAWRQTVHRTLHGVLMVVWVLVCMLLPFALVAAGVITPLYRIDASGFTILPHAHEFPATPMLVYLVASTLGTVTAAAVYGRLFVAEIREAERKLTFQAWQLQQLVPPEPDPRR